MECYRTIFLSGTEGGEVLYIAEETRQTAGENRRDKARASKSVVHLCKQLKWQMADHQIHKVGTELDAIRVQLVCPALPQAANMDIGLIVYELQ